MSAPSSAGPERTITCNRCGWTGPWGTLWMHTRDVHDAAAGPERETVEALLTRALHETETTGGWWGHPECEEFGRLIAPKVASYVAAAVESAKAEAWDEAHGTNERCAGLGCVNPYRAATEGER